MSLINQMLKDLEARRAPALDETSGALQGLSWSGAREGNSRSPLLFGLGLAAGLVLFGAGGVSLWQFALQDGVQSPPLGQKPATAPAADLAVSPAAPPVAESVPVSADVQGAPGPQVNEPVAAADLGETVASSSADRPLVRERLEPAPQREPSNPAPAVVPGNTNPLSVDSGVAVAEVAPSHTQSEAAPNMPARPPVESEVVSKKAARLPAEPEVAADSRRGAEPPQPLPGGTVAGTGVQKTLRPPSPEQRATEAYQQGYRALASSDSAQAEASLREALRLQPGHRAAREALVGVMVEAGRLVEARALLEEGMRKHPDRAQFVRLYARILAEQGEGARAVRTLERHAAELAADPDYYALLGALYQRQQRHSDAAGVYRELVKLRPATGAWWAGLGMALDAQGDRAGGREAFIRALRAGGLAPALRKHVRTRLTALENSYSEH